MIFGTPYLTLERNPIAIDDSGTDTDSEDDLPPLQQLLNRRRSSDKEREGTQGGDSAQAEGQVAASRTATPEREAGANEGQHQRVEPASPIEGGKLSTGPVEQALGQGGSYLDSQTSQRPSSPKPSRAGTVSEERPDTLADSHRHPHHNSGSDPERARDASAEAETEQSSKRGKRKRSQHAKSLYQFPRSKKP